MAARTVTAPDGTQWKVGRLWLPERKLRWRGRGRKKLKRDAENAGDVGFDGSTSSSGGGGGGNWWSFDSIGDDIAVALAIILAIGLFILLFLLIATVIFPLIVLGLEVILILVLLIGGVAGRLLFRRPWTVRARAGDGRTLRWHVHGFRNSGSVRDDVAAALVAGQGEPNLPGATRLPDPAAPAAAQAQPTARA